MGVLRWRDRASADHVSTPGPGECTKLQEAQVSGTYSNSKQHRTCLEGGKIMNASYHAHWTKKEILSEHEK
jgi:hypothetical protein